MNRRRSFSSPITTTRNVYSHSTYYASQFFIVISNSSTVPKSHTHDIFCTNVNSSMFKYFREILIIIPHLISHALSVCLSVSLPFYSARNHDYYPPSIYLLGGPFLSNCIQRNAHLRKLQISHNLCISKRRTPMITSPILQLLAAYPQSSSVHNYHRVLSSSGPQLLDLRTIYDPIASLYCHGPAFINSLSFTRNVVSVIGKIRSKILCNKPKILYIHSDIIFTV